MSRPAQETGKLAGRVALVTGAASGIGRATAILFARQGATVLCADLDLTGARAAADAIAGSGGAASPVRLDVAHESDWTALLEKVLGDHGRLDVLVNCAGISSASPVVETDLAEWRRVMAVNLDGVFLGTKHAVRAMRPGGGGCIVNVSSVSGIRAAAGAGAYSASKAAVCTFSRVVAKECLEAGDGIRVNTVCPGGVKTPMWTTMPFFRDLVARTGSEDAAYRELAGDTPGARFAEPEEVAAAILYLVSDEAKSVTGTELVIDNGYTA